MLQKTVPTTCVTPVSFRGGQLFNVILPWCFVGLFFLFVLVFLIAPAIFLIIQSFSGEHGFTWHYLAQLLTPQYRIAFKNSITLSMLSACSAMVLGGLLAYVMLRPGAPAWLQSSVTSFSAVAANFAGVPLAFAFISTLGSLGYMTVLLKHLGINIYNMGFSLYSIGGLTLTYSYFQIPLMLIIILPAFEAMRQQWHEAAQNLGANAIQFWCFIGLPILAPSLLAAFLLLFGSAFSAFATPYALTDGNISLVTIDIANVLSGNVSSDPQVGAALSTGMILVMVVVMLTYSFVSRLATKWRR